MLLMLKLRLKLLLLLFELFGDAAVAPEVPLLLPDPLARRELEQQPVWSEIGTHAQKDAKVKLGDRAHTSLT